MENGNGILVVKMSMSYVSRATEVGEARGLMRVVVDTETDQILGFACLGIEGGEIMSIVVVAFLNS